ncbi:MAG: LUD domain-containing protein [Actinobacteria bacterium]|nr:LUD domain-containing protein [Actinomycetota bacterium]
MTAGARREVLARVRAALRDVPPDEAPKDVPVERGYRTRDDAPPGELIDRFAERVEEYEARVLRVDADQVAAAVATACAARGARRLVIPHDLPAEWRPDGVELVADRVGAPLDHATLDGLDGALTGCALGIAETGTIVLDSGAGQGRRVISLLPDYHLCVVGADRVVGSVPEAVAALADAVAAGRPLTWISGPSATSDIELDRVEGVHGPRTLEVLLVG